ncbi:3-hydroxybutyrate dehydrogenase [Grimontia hollisae]|uniref:D-beta-hydroxybutyrate dehydrogenase n=1 Tax=Grimontia hollisae CIP 101886 TaxID=675812 RepID=D0I6K9_GRIHO|nr:3-hydroxybutyrate dehydrogenase [Grimontia hollisae]AMG31534.1 3-hydroxybutyrate dehydrogenase [Grimontia hollisae]EEY72278.1 D-beta-hydroxybutyrate dehydrogenase [Grimontia hollisae CIP 101886]STO45408.1 D-beta-hydroxybutyrate dehydrogenase [Grimontia hollisae]
MAAKHVLVTGGASGIGFGMAKGFAQAGYKVTLSDINSEALENAVNTLTNQFDVDVKGLELDVTDSGQLASAPSRVDAPVDILINNAGIQFVSALEQFPEEKWRLIIDILLCGPAMLTKAFLPSMYARNFGRIINVGSIHSLVASPYKSAYVSAKHGLLGFAKTIALESAGHDVTINTLCPSYVKTPLVDNQIRAQADNHGISEQEVINTIMLKPMPKKAFIALTELAETAMFLASPAAKNITAQAIAIDGGWTAH